MAELKPLSEWTNAELIAFAGSVVPATIDSDGMFRLTHPEMGTIAFFEQVEKEIQSRSDALQSALIKH